jgi:hypothetical protein
MHHRIVFGVLLCLAMLSTTFAYQMTFVNATIVSVERKDQAQSSAGTGDQPLQSNLASWKFVVNTGSVNYTCVFDTNRSADPTWAAGREIQVSIKGKVLFAKRANGNVERCSIIHQEPAK